MYTIYYIDIFNRGCRLGGNIINYICQIIFATKHNYYIKYDKNLLRYYDSIFVKLLFEYVDVYNKVFISKFNNTEFYIDSKEIQFERININTADFPHMMSNITRYIKSDMISYFRDNILKYLKNGLDILAKERQYVLPYNPDNTIVVHLRLEDVRNVKDYDGRLCGSYYAERINNDQVCYYISDEKRTINQQAPLSYEKINDQIQKALEKHPGFNVLIITNPGEKVDLPYRVIYNTDPSYDLYLLSKSKVLILSRSTFAISALFFGEQRDVYFPIWGHAVCCGVYTNFDKCMFNYFF